MTFQKALSIFQLSSLESTDAKALKKRYLKLVKVMHPDVVGESGEKAFKELGIAYTILKNALNNSFERTITVNNTGKHYEKAEYISFEELIKCFENRDVQKFVGKTWIINFKVLFKTSVGQLELVMSAAKNKNDEYNLVVYLPFEDGEKLEVDFYGINKELTLSGIGSRIFINYNYLAKITIHVMRDSDTGGK